MMLIQHQYFTFEPEFAVREYIRQPFGLGGSARRVGGAVWSAITSALNFFSSTAEAAAAAAESDSILLDPPFQAKNYDPIATMGVEAQGTTSKENLVGSQKRKARKNKIIHLVRTADGTVSLVEGEEAPDECLRPYLHFIISETCWGFRTRLN